MHSSFLIFLLQTPYSYHPLLYVVHLGEHVFVRLLCVLIQHAVLSGARTSFPVLNNPHIAYYVATLRVHGCSLQCPRCIHQVPRQEVLLDLEQKSAATSLNIRQGSAPPSTSQLLSATRGAPTAGFVVDSGVVLQFDAYFKETVDESPLENHRVRKCRILFYLEDSSMQIDEYRQENSGIPQGTLVKRHQIHYPKVGRSALCFRFRLAAVKLNLYSSFLFDSYFPFFSENMFDRSICWSAVATDRWYI